MPSGSRIEADGAAIDAADGGPEPADGIYCVHCRHPGGTLSGCRAANEAADGLFPWYVTRR
jgi:hypothetical protein